MATVLADGMILRIRAVCYDSFDVQLGESVTHWQVQSHTGNPDNTDVAAAFAGSLAAPYKAWLGTNVTFRGVGVTIIKPTLVPEIFNVAFAGAGVSGGVAQPPQVSGLIRHQSENYYVGPSGKTRRAQGRLYVPFPGVSWVGNPDPMSAGGLAALNAIAAAWGTSKSCPGHGGAAQLILGTYVTLGPGPTLVKDFQPSVTIFASNLWATQRRRGEYGRTNVDPFQ